MKNTKQNIVLILHDIRSVYNVGAIFRTADAAGVSKIYLSGVTPLPIDRFGRKRKDFAKCALGAEENVAWEKMEEILTLISKLKKDGYKIIAVEQDKKSVDYKKIKIGEKTAIILGNEVAGLPKNILKFYIIKIDDRPKELAFPPSAFNNRIGSFSVVNINSV